MGRLPTGKTPAQPLLSIATKHREIMRRLVAGEKQHSISVEMGISESRLSIICNSPLFKRELKKLEDEVKGRFIKTSGDIALRINGLQDKAVDVLEKILKEPKVDEIKVSPSLKKETALDILELAGNGKRKINNTVADAMGDVVHVIREGFQLAKELRDRELEIARQSKEVNENNGSNLNGNTNGGNSQNHVIDITPREEQELEQKYLESAPESNA